MPRGREPAGQAARTNAERQARFRARRQTPQPQLTIQRRPAPARPSRTKRWNDALAERIAVQTECAAWFDALPESLRDSATAEALQDRIDLDLDAIAAIQPPRGYGRDGPARHDVWPKRGAGTMPGRDEGTGVLIEPRNNQKRASWPCGQDQPSLTVGHPMVGETEHASHTEIRTLPRIYALQSSGAPL